MTPPTIELLKLLLSSHLIYWDPCIGSDVALTRMLFDGPAKSHQTSRVTLIISNRETEKYAAL
jgi:hypothetical protein